MSVDYSLRPLFREIRQYREAAASSDQPGLKGGDGNGTSGGMEARLARLESDVEHIKKAVDKIDRGQEDVRKAVSELKVDFGKFDERSKHFPSKGFIFGVSAALLGAGSAVMAILIRVMQ